MIRLLELLWRVMTGSANGFHKIDEAEESLHLAKELREEIGAAGGAKP